MAEPSSIDNGGKDATPTPSGAEGSHPGLPLVESPSISPANNGLDLARAEPTAAPAAEIPPGLAAGPGSKIDRIEQAVTSAPAARNGFMMTPRMKRTASRAATVAIAAALGAIFGILAMQWLAPVAPRQDVASMEERQAMQKSIARLAKDIAVLKAGVDANNRATTTQIEKIVGRIERSDRAPDTTGSIAKVAAADLKDTPLPPPRPRIVQGWSVYESRDGFVLAEQQGGDLFRISPGVPLPGLGPVETVRRDNGRLVVVTPKGLIVQATSATARARPRPPFPFDRF